MNATKSFGILVIALSAIACGGSSSSSDLCTTMGTATTSFVNKAQPCLGSSTPTIGFTQQQCSAALAQCNDSDKQKLQSFANCLNGLSTCSMDTITAWSASLQTCVNFIENCSGSTCTSTLSPGCQ